MRSRLRTLALALAAAAPLVSQQPKANAVVASDGTGMYKTVQAAIDAVPQNTSASNRWTIFIKAGTYRERVYVQREKTARYEEFGNTGSGGASRGRVSWARTLTAADAQSMSATAVLRGADGWNPVSK